MIYAHARVSADAHDLSSQVAQLKAAGCSTIFREEIIGTHADRPQLKKLRAKLANGSDRLRRTGPRHAGYCRQA